MPNYFYYQGVNKDDQWKAVPASLKDKVLVDHKAVFCTALAVSKLPENIEPAEKDKLAYSGPLYLDWDSLDLGLVIQKTNQTLDKLQEMGVNLACVSLYATGQKGFHATIPELVFQEKMPKGGVVQLPLIYKEMVFELAVDTLDLKIYSCGRGRMWRIPNVQRPDNGLYKVPLTVDEVRAMTPESYAEIVKAPRMLVPVAPPEFSVDLHLMYAHAKQKVEERLKTRGTRKRDPQAKMKAQMPSVKLMMAGKGIKTDVGFHAIAMQVTIAAVTAGMKPEEMVKECAGLIESHESDSNRYNTPAKRQAELLRLYDYMLDNPGYDFGVGAIKSLLTHEAPDLDNLPVTEEEVKAVIEEAAVAAASPTSPDDIAPDEYGDVAGGVTMSRYGVYIDTENGKKRICAISFTNIHLMYSMESGTLSGYEAEVLINGRSVGRQMLEMDTFRSIQHFNNFGARHGHAMQGLEPHVRGLMMRFVEDGKKKGKQYYIAKREGLDVVNIPNHPDERMREPFMIFAAGSGVLVEPRVRDLGLDISFQGFPDPRGSYHTDLADAPQLADWIELPESKEALRQTLVGMFSMQSADMVSKLVGWYTACFYRMLFHKAYGKFPLLHVNGPAGSGKCLGAGTPVLLADGTVIPVEKVRPGDKLLGPDGQPRNVLSTCHGSEMLYRVTPVKGDPYVVNESHILSLKKSGTATAPLANGQRVPAGVGIVNMNVKLFADSPKAGKVLKGWRSPAVEFDRAKEPLLLDPYWMGCWLGDGRSNGPEICKPANTKMIQSLIAKAEAAGHTVTKYEYGQGCPSWAFCEPLQSSEQGKRGSNGYLNALRQYSLIDNKHIPDAYLYADKKVRQELLAGLLDSDGHLSGGGYDWVSKSKKLADQFVFLCRSLGLAAYSKECRKGVGDFEGDYWRVSVSGECSDIPCLDKKAAARKQVKDVLVTGLTVEPIGVGDYYGFQIDGDHLFLLGDFTVTHNTEMNLAMASLFFYHQEPKRTSPGSSLFAISQYIAGSASIPLIIDEYKPHEMLIETHNQYKRMFRDAYNCGEISKGGGTRESADYRTLHQTQLAAPIVFIAEAAEEESAVAERVVLITVVKPPSSTSLRQLQHYNTLNRTKQNLAILGQYLAKEIVEDMTVTKLREQFDPIYEEAKSKYMLTDADMKKGLSAAELALKQGAKERSVFNYTVVRFGLLQFKRLIEAIYDDEFAEQFKALEGAVYNRMQDLQAATQAEWVKVMAQMSFMSWNLDLDSPSALRYGKEYAMLTVGGKDMLEVSLRACYLKYRLYSASTRSKILFAGDQQFMHAMKDSAALISSGTGSVLKMPGIYTFDVAKLAEMGVDAFRPPK